MNDQFSMTVRQRDEASAVRLAGVIDETNRLAELVEQVETRIAVINLAGVERINSRGTRDWIYWLAALEAKGIQPVLVACSPAIVTQLNLVKAFAGHAQVKSFYAPYRCACGAKQRLLVHINDMDAADREPPRCVCEACEAAMTFDGDPTSYFAFLAHVARSRDSQPEITPSLAPSSPDLIARGSNAAVAVPRTQSRTRLSQPRMARASLSVFPKLDVAPERPSMREITTPRAQPRSERPYLFVIVGLLACSVLLLGYLFLI